MTLRESHLPFLDRSAHYCPADAGVDVDIFAYTQVELDAMLAAGNMFLAQALREGITLSGAQSLNDKEQAHG